MLRSLSPIHRLAHQPSLAYQAVHLPSSAAVHAAVARIVVVWAFGRHIAFAAVERQAVDQPVRGTCPAACLGIRPFAGAYYHCYPDDVTVVFAAAQDAGSDASGCGVDPYEGSVAALPCAVDIVAVYLGGAAVQVVTAEVAEVATYLSADSRIVLADPAGAP